MHRPHAFMATVIAAIVAWQFAPAAAVVTYDIVYLKSPRPGGDAKPSKIPDILDPMRLEPGTDLVLLHPDGSEELLLAGGAKGAVADPCVSYDGKAVYASVLPNVVDLSNATYPNVPVAGADIVRIDIATKRVTQLTHGEYTPSAAGPAKLPFGVFNMGACPLAGGRIVFTSNRNGFLPTKGLTPVTSQLYTMKDDGSDVEAISPMTLGAALHPFQLTDGRIAFSTYETQGLRDSRLWGYWAIWPDGTTWEPLWSAFIGPDMAVHWASQLSDGDLVVTAYYNLNNLGFGAFLRSPTTAAGPSFGPAQPALNAALTMTSSIGRGEPRFPFSPVGARSITPWTHSADLAAPRGAAGVYAGKVTQPSGAPNDDLLLVWTPGPANHQQAHTPTYDAGLYLMRGGTSTAHTDLVLIKNDPRYNEQQPRAVVPYRAIYGVDEPKQLPINPNDGSRHAVLPAATPYGIVGTSSFYKRESFPGVVRPGSSYDGLESFNPPLETFSNWIWQGSDAGKYADAEIDAVRIVVMEPRSAGESRWWVPIANERLRVLGEVPLRKPGVMDPDGNPDTSFSARIPADTPFTFQLLDKDGRVLTMAQTWHQVRPGEVRVDCGGCHAHSQKPLKFEDSAAAKLPPTDLTLQPAHDVEFIRDIRPILQAKCVSCHRGENPPAKLRFDLTAPASAPWPEPTLPPDYGVLARNPSGRFGGITAPNGTYNPPNASRYVRLYQSRRSLLAWMVSGARLDGWTNEKWATDVDYHDPANHGSMLSPAERRMFTTWIDLSAPLDLGAYFQDETRPALALTVTQEGLLIGVADAYSGVAPESLTVTINGRRATLQAIGDARWRTSSPVQFPAKVVARVRDRAGNWMERQVQFMTSAPPASTANPMTPAVGTAPR